ncbi:hypothetical protein BCR42DRAFT_415725 [Absidia repens]|uniref:Uncharacterized protein n=1 Tax=Absidia repens TaxID=90262 RepID=A0A1X2IH73_9FUNG|nr:hypothetical protein BCR42DRAFT_415725 [Absidia repens]
MGLAEFALISRKWKPATLLHKTTNEYPSLLEYISSDVLDSRLSTISTLIRNTYPQIWIDTYLFFLAIFFVLFAAAFAIGLQATASQRDKLWYPLLILIAPVFIAFWTSRRRATHYERLKNFNDLLQKCLKEFNSADTTLHIKWQYRRLREDDTVESLGLIGPISQWQVVLVIEVIQIDPEDIHQMANEVDMVLPSYYAAVEDVVLDIGPLDRTEQHPIEQQDLSDHTHQQQPSLSYPLPPEYNGSSYIPEPRREMEYVSPATSSPPTYQR